MLRFLVRLIGFRLIGRAAAPARKRFPLLDVKLGSALFRDRRVAGIHKLAALVLGAVATMVLVSMELPVEGIVAALLNVAGLGLDFVVDGLEAIIGPLLMAAIFLPWLAPRALVERIQRERLLGPGTIAHDATP